MKKHLWNSSLIFIIGLIATTHTYSDKWAYLKGITNNSGYRVTVVSSDKEGSMNDIEGTPLDIRKENDLSKINNNSMNLVIPQFGWSGSAEIAITLYDHNVLLGQYYLSDYKGNILISWLNLSSNARFGPTGPTATATNVSTLSKYVNTDTNVTVTISEAGASGLTATATAN